MNENKRNTYIITAGSTYLDIDAYACMLGMAELLRLKNIPVVAWSDAPCNYSVCKTLVEEGQVLREMPSNFDGETAKYIIVDVSDPEFLKDSVPLDKVIEVYDHHVGFEDYWKSRIGEGAHIEFIGAAATLIYREWKRAGLTREMKRHTAKLLTAAILDNTLNLTSSNTTKEDIETFHALCAHAGIGEEFRAEYFSEVQKSVELDLKNALFGDIKTVRDNPILPPRVAQLCVWSAESILLRLDEIRGWFAPQSDPWMINIIDLSGNCSYLVCDDEHTQRKLEPVFNVSFEDGVACTEKPYLRKQIIKKTVFWV